jgi:alanine racemase
MAVVKANAYGHGVDLVVPVLASGGVKNWGCASVAEGCAARDILAKIGDDSGHNVYVMPATPLSDVDLLVERRLTPYCTDFELAKALSACAVSAGKTAALHVEVDTGIGRAGSAPADLADFVKAVRALPGIRITGVCTHFTAADDPDGADDALMQHKIFTDALATLDQEWLGGVTVHASNSPAVFRLGGARHDLIRPGLLLYGIGPCESMIDGKEGFFPYRPVMTLKAKVLLVRRLAAGATISYNRTYRLEKDATIATIAIGYGDGFPRRLSNIGTVLLPGGLEAPIRGRVCMDQLCVELPDNSGVKVGDEAILIGKSGSKEISALGIADLIQTTPHEITTSLLPRIERVLV